MLTGEGADSRRSQLVALAAYPTAEARSREAGRALRGALALALFACLAAPAGALSLVDRPDFADLIYDAGTGNVKLDPTDEPFGGFHSFVLRNAAGGDDFDTGAVMLPPGGLTTILATEIGWSDAFTTAAGVQDLGDIFPAGLDLSGLDAFLTQADYVAALGTGIAIFDAIVVRDGQVPEPGTSALAAFALVTIVWRRRTRAPDLNG